MIMTFAVGVVISFIRHIELVEYETSNKCVRFLKVCIVFIKHVKNKHKQTGLFSIRAEKQYSSFAGHWLVALLEHILPEHARGAGEVVAQPSGSDIRGSWGT